MDKSSIPAPLSDQANRPRPILAQEEILGRLNDREHRLLHDINMNPIPPKLGRETVARFWAFGPLLYEGWFYFIRAALAKQRCVFHPSLLQLMLHALHDAKVRKKEVSKSRAVFDGARKSYIQGTRFAHSAKFAHRKHYPRTHVSLATIRKQSMGQGNGKNSLFFPGVISSDIEAAYYSVALSFFARFLERVPASLCVEFDHPIGVSEGEITSVLHLDIGNLGAVHGWPTTRQESVGREVVSLAKLFEPKEWSRADFCARCLGYLAR